jgi:hypothetical protein
MLNHVVHIVTIGFKWLNKQHIQPSPYSEADSLSVSQEITPPFKKPEIILVFGSNPAHLVTLYNIP